MGSSTASGPVLSREASPKNPVHDLVGDQKSVAIKVWDAIKELAAIPYEGRERLDETDPLLGILPPLDADRRSQVFLIDGNRGTGKTTVMLSLLEQWKKFRTERGYTPPPPLSALAGSTVLPIHIVDLNPLPASTNLLLLLAGQFKRVLDSVEAAAGPVSLNKELDSRKAWREFLEVAGTAWSGNLSERRPELDSESYIMELEQVELQRPLLHDRFSKLIDALCQDYRKWEARSYSFKEPPWPLWVIPIDDADMNPGRTVELLLMLRTLYHPRVVFLLTGDSELMKEILQAYFLGELCAPLRHVSLALSRTKERRSTKTGVTVRSYSQLAQELYDRGRRLAKDFYDKAIPWPHRWRIEELPLSARLDLLKDDLKRFGFTLDPALESTSISDRKLRPLFDIFEALEQTAQALPSRFRTLDAVRAEILTALPPPNEEKLVIGKNARETSVDVLYKFLQNRWRYYVEHSDLPKKDIENLLSMLDRSRHGDITVDLNPSERSAPPLVRFELLRDHERQRQNTNSKKSAELELGLYKEEMRGWLHDQRRLSDAITGALLLIMSAAPYTSQYSKEHGKFSQKSLSPAWCMVGHYQKIGPTSQMLWIGWPIPDWESPFLWMTLNRRWRQFMKESAEQIRSSWKNDSCLLSENHVLSEFLAINFLSAVLSVCKFDEKFEIIRKPTQRHWTKFKDGLQKWMDSEAQTSLPRRQIDQMEWVKHRVPLLALPESGLHPKVANTIYETLEAVHGSQAIEKAIIQKTRKQRIEAALKSHRDSGVISDEQIKGEVSKALEKFCRQQKSKQYELHKILTPKTG